MATKTIKTNDIKKGDRLQLTNGWYATMMDNKKGNTRMANVEGVFNEMGSIYVWDIHVVKPEGTNEWLPVELTESQVTRKKQSKAFGL